MTSTKTVRCPHCPQRHIVTATGDRYVTQAANESGVVWATMTCESCSKLFDFNLEHGDTRTRPTAS